MMKRKWIFAVTAGTLCAAIEFGLILAFEPNASLWLLLQSGFAWFACGILVILAESGLPPMLHSVLLTMLINSGWFVAESFAKGKSEHFIPLIVASAVLGLLTGLLRKRSLGAIRP